MGAAGGDASRDRSRRQRLKRVARQKPPAGKLEDVVTYLEMNVRPSHAPVPLPLGKVALMRAEPCTVSFYRYLYAAVGERWLWFERRIWDDETLRRHVARPEIEIFVLHVGGSPAGYFELDRGKSSDV